MYRLLRAFDQKTLDAHAGLLPGALLCQYAKLRIQFCNSSEYNGRTGFGAFCQPEHSGECEKRHQNNFGNFKLFQNR